MKLGKSKKQTAEEKSVEILKKIEGLVKEYKEVIETMDAKDQTKLMMTQALVVSVWSPNHEMGFNAQIGYKMLCEGMVNEMVEKNERPSLPSFSDLLKHL